MPGAESTYRQFDSNGMPYWTNSRGFGLMQLDPPLQPYEYRLWHWQNNAQDGAPVVMSKFSGYDGADQFYARQVNQWQAYNANPQYGPVGAYQTTNEGTNCVFGMDNNGAAPATGQWYRDAVWIKQYNSASRFPGSTFRKRTCGINRELASHMLGYVDIDEPVNDASLSQILNRRSHLMESDFIILR